MEIPINLASADTRWHPHAACTRAGPDDFYDHRSQVARRLCSTCPASEPCLWAALALEQILGYRHGIWGGTTAARRERIVASLPHLDYQHMYLAVVDIWQPPAAGVTRSGLAA